MLNEYRKDRGRGESGRSQEPMTRQSWLVGHGNVALQRCELDTITWWSKQQEGNRRPRQKGTDEMTGLLRRDTGKT